MTSDEISQPVPLGENIFHERKRKTITCGRRQTAFYGQMYLFLFTRFLLTTQTSERIKKKEAGNLALRSPFFCTTAHICFLPVGSMRIELGSVPGALKYRERQWRGGG